MTVDELATVLGEHRAFAGTRLLVLHGSRARGDHSARSDWDVGVLSDPVPDPPGPDLPGPDLPGPDLPGMLAALTEVLGTDAVDLVDLRRASALLRYRAARDGVALRESAPDAFQDFRLEAVLFWCDAGPVIRAAQDDVLAALG